MVFNSFSYVSIHELTKLWESHIDSESYRWSPRVTDWVRELDIESESYGVWVRELWSLIPNPQGQMFQLFF